MPALELRILSPQKPVVSVPLVEGLTFGRHPDNRIVLDDSKVSGFHAAVVKAAAGELALVDLGSLNKSRVEGGRTLEKDESELLRPGVRIFLGKTEIQVVLAGGTLQEASTGVKSAFAAAETARALPPVPHSPPGRERAHGISTTDSVREAWEGLLRPEQAEPLAPDQQRSFVAAHPRVIVVLPTERRTVVLERPSIVFGRSHRADSGVDCVLDDESVSSVHAAITFEYGRFVIRDLGSRNGTKLDGQELAPREVRLLGRDARITLGKIECLFIFDQDPTGKPFPIQIYEHALETLVEDGSLTKKEAAAQARALRYEGRHPSAELIQAGRLTVAAWSAALVKAPHHERNVSSQRRVLWFIVLAGVAAAMAAAYYWSSGRR